jgi:hypothetical protein
LLSCTEINDTRNKAKQIKLVGRKNKLQHTPTKPGRGPETRSVRRHQLTSNRVKDA